jgi:hypothetical protein
VLPAFGAIVRLDGPFLVPLLLLLSARIVAWATLPMASEDAYITFRYARNLAVGNELAYNPGERVCGFSSPIWTIWMALGFWLRVDPVVWSRATAVGSDVMTLLLIGRLMVRHFSVTAAWCFAVFFAAWPTFSAVAVSGMENSTVLCGIALGAVLTESRRRLSGPLLAAVALARPEGVASAFVLALGARLRDRLVAVGLFGIGLAALWVWFGTPVPQSVVAKAQIYGTPGPWLGRHWWEWLLPVPAGRWPSVGEGDLLFPLAVVFSPAVVLGVREMWRARHTALARAAAAALVVWLGYAVLGVAYFFWYFAVPLGGLAILGAVGLPRITRGRALYLGCLLYVLGSWVHARPLYVGRAQNEYHGFAKVAAYLRDNAQPGEKVMLEPIGMIGYHCPLEVVDEVGLVSPHVARRRLEGPGWYTDVASSEKPNWLVLRRGVLSGGTAFAGVGAPFRNVAERDSLLARYELMTIADEHSGDRALAVLRRVR